MKRALLAAAVCALPFTTQAQEFKPHQFPTEFHKDHALVATFYGPPMCQPGKACSKVFLGQAYDTTCAWALRDLEEILKRTAPKQKRTMECMLEAAADKTNVGVLEYALEKRYGRK